MPSGLLHNTPYKGLFIVILVFVILEYLFNTVSDTRNAIFTNRSVQYFDKPLVSYHPLLKTFFLKRPFENLTTTPSPQLSSRIEIEKISSTNSSNLNYVITEPSFSTERAQAANTTTPPAPNEPICQDKTQYLYGRVQVRKYPVPSVQELEDRFAWLQPGGHWAPPNCTIEKKVAIVIPFRCRGEHLLLFLQHMHPFLKKQQLDYTIFVVEQDRNSSFNRAMLMNIGYVEALKAKLFDCFIFHDVDLLPEDDRNLYTCPKQPRHMSVAVDTFNYKLPYPAIFGGVSAISAEHFKLLNGFSNSFWGWGGEDDDMSNRIRYHHLLISRYPITIARYTMLKHKKGWPNPHRHDLLRRGQKYFNKDGLSDLTYELIKKKENLLYTWILVKLNPPNGS